MSDSGLGVQHGFAKRIFVLSVPMIDAITAFPPAGGFAVGVRVVGRIVEFRRGVSGRNVNVQAGRGRRG